MLVLTFASDEEIQSTCLRWIAEFLLFVQPVMVPFTPRLIPVILSSLAHHVAPIRLAANDTNYNLFGVIQATPAPHEPPPTPAAHHLSPPAAVAQGKQPESRGDGAPVRGRNIGSSPPMTSLPFPSARMPSSDRGAAVKAAPADTLVSPVTSRFESLVGMTDIPDGERSRSSFSGDYAGEVDPFDYGATVNALTLQFLNEHEETRVAALEWLLMLHQKAPKKVSSALLPRRHMLIVFPTRFSLSTTHQARRHGHVRVPDTPTITLKAVSA